MIVGGESGPGLSTVVRHFSRRTKADARPMKKEWAESILRQCHRAGVPFFFKQWGGVRKDLSGRRLNGKIYDEMPERNTEKILRGI